MGKNEQIQGQELNVDAATTHTKMDCYWFEPINQPLGEMARLELEVRPMKYKQIDVVLYQGKISQIICPYLNGRVCSSPEKDLNRDCYLLPGTPQ